MYNRPGLFFNLNFIWPIFLRTTLKGKLMKVKNVESQKLRRSNTKTSCSKKVFFLVFGKNVLKIGHLYLCFLIRSLDFAKNSLKWGLLWYLTPQPKFHVYQNSSSWIIIEHCLNQKNCRSPESSLSQEWVEVWIWFFYMWVTSCLVLVRHLWTWSNYLKRQDKIKPTLYIERLQTEYCMKLIFLSVFPCFNWLAQPFL